MIAANQGIVSTIPDRCRRCFTCIRECPAAAIKVINGQAAVMGDRCISCGHCVKVCSQNAKKIQSDLQYVSEVLLAGKNTVAVVAPSFAASFPEEYLKLPAALRKLGFGKAVETAFGADLISEYYRQVFKSDERKTLISSACPAVVNYIEKYRPELVPNIARVVSPMIALGKYLKTSLQKDTKVVFIGPCIAKKYEYADEPVAGVIDAVLTFAEVKKLLKEKDIYFPSLNNEDFDPPHAFMGKVYPLAGGLIKTAEISGDILEKEIIVVEGKQKVIEIIDGIANKSINAGFVDILFCEGCISGPAIDSNLNYYSRREKVIDYISEKIHTDDKQIWKSNIYNSRNINFSRDFIPNDQRKPYPGEEKILEILAKTDKFTVNDELNCGACGYNTCRDYAVAIAKELAESEMCLPYLIDQLNKAYNDLNDAQEQLRTAEKLVSIGQLAAGVAHEINNPLGTIMLYASLLKKTIEKKLEENQPKEDIELIIDEANRCKNIVANLLNFAREGKLNLSEVNILSVIDGIIKTAKKNPVFKDIEIKTESGTAGYIIEGDEDQLKQVFLNLINNALESVEDSDIKKVEINISEEDGFLVIIVSDTGTGIARENSGKIFTPFFTTKKIGKGTGLGLAISYGIVKMHHGFISFKSESGKGTSFFVKLPGTISAGKINMN